MYNKLCISLFEYVLFRSNRMASKLRKLSEKVRVKNAQGTSGDNPPGEPDTWGSYWKKYSGRRWPKECRIYRCTAKPKVGGHVKIHRGKTEYIIPMCKKHNHYKKASPMRVNKGTIAVLENLD